MKWVLILYLFSGMNSPFQEVGSFSPLASMQIECFENERKFTTKNWRAALQQRAEDLKKETCFNAADAFAFIETMHDYEAQSYHELAEHFYFKALRTPFTTKNFSLLKKEAQKIIPLLSSAQQNQWKEKIKKQDVSLATDIQQFWVRRDPVLTTPANERLSEHWERITYARQHYTQNTDGIYKTDDRGLIYVKYGPPTVTRSGLLMPDPTDIRARLYDISAYKGGLTQQEMFSLNMSIRQTYTPQKYEVWIYKNVSTRNRVLYIFGNSADKGTFGLRNSVEEFISTSTFNNGIGSSWRFDTGPRGLTAGPFLQTALYSALSPIDIYFGRQLLNYDYNWNNYFSGDADFTTLKMQNNNLQAKNELRRLQSRAPNAYSAVQHNLGNLQHSFRSYRFLDSQFKPIHRILVFAKPAKQLLKYDRHRTPGQQTDYRIDHILKISGSASGDPVSLNELSPLENKTGFTGYLLQAPDSLLSGSSGIIQIGSEIKRYMPKGEGLRQHVVIIASTVSEFKRPSPLSPSGGPFNVSDILWGYKPAPKNHDMQTISFAVPPDSSIPFGKNLNIYFETYHTSSPSDDIYSYQLEYEIKRIEKRELVDRGIKLSLSFEADTPITSESFEIDTSQLEPGRYRGIFRFGKPSLPASAGIERTFDFEIRE